MAATRKQIAFDLDTNALKTYYPSEHWNNAYDVIRRHMEKNDFKWQQGSVYVSNKAMSSYRVARILENLVSKNPWLNVCMRDCRETNIGREHNKNHIFDKNADVLTREELRAQNRQEKEGNLSDYSAEINTLRQSEQKADSKEPVKESVKQRNSNENTDR